MLAKWKSVWCCTHQRTPDRSVILHSSPPSWEVFSCPFCVTCSALTVDFPSFRGSRTDIDCTEQWWHCYSLAEGLIIRTLLHHLLEFVNRQETGRQIKPQNCITWKFAAHIKVFDTACGPSLTIMMKGSAVYERKRLQVSVLCPLTGPYSQGMMSNTS